MVAGGKALLLLGFGVSAALAWPLGGRPGSIKRLLNVHWSRVLQEADNATNVTVVSGEPNCTRLVPADEDPLGGESPSGETRGRCLVEGNGYVCGCCECEANPCCTGGMFLAGLFEGMRETSTSVRIPVYLVLLLWMFMGVGMIADVFMMAIEVITSTEKTLKTKDGKTMTVLIWNDTVANLSLMALGSSAPEILLNVFEILGEKFYAGGLGPSTIVGSAAFNLFVIAAVCVIAIDPSDKRNIESMTVFKVTACFSVFAYLWLLVILVAISPDVIEVWEAAVTFAFFPFLVWMAYAADTGVFSKSGGSGITPAAEGHIVGMKDAEGRRVSTARAYGDPSETAKLIKDMKATFGAGISDEDLEKHIMMHAAKNTRRSRAAYRINATRMLTGGKPVIPVIPDGAMMKRQSIVPEVAKTSEFTDAVFFDTPAIAVMENIGAFDVFVTCSKALSGDEKVTVKYVTVAGTATKDDDYEHAEGTLEFNASKKQCAIPIKIIDDVQFEPDEHFFIELSSVKGAKTGGYDKTTITIKNDDMPGNVDFPSAALIVTESDGFVNVEVRRKDGCSGDISVNYESVDDSALAGKDYNAVKGVLEFKHTEEIKTIVVEIIDDASYEKDEHFKIKLSEPGGGAELGENPTLTMTIKSDDGVKGLADKLTGALNINKDLYKIGTSSWGGQFQDAITLEVEEGEKPGLGTYAGFAFALPFKVVFATVPPTTFGGGWVCFFVALIYIGCVTILIGDLAGQLGCVLGLEDEITAITLVALGTSLPDTFASMAAAKGDPAADAAIGNITGSNAVNVFLGLGLPWLMGAVFWAMAEESDFGDNAAIMDKDGMTWSEKYKDAPLGCTEGVDCIPDRTEAWAHGFVVVAGNLGFSVMIFSICAVICLGTLVARQFSIGAMLGGAAGPQKATAVFFIALWGLYIGMSIMKIKEAPPKC